jgi:ATP-dependent Clp protease protease subunit
MSGLVSRFKAANSLLSSKNAGKKIAAFFLASAMAATGANAFAKEQNNTKPGTTHVAKNPATSKGEVPQAQQIEIPDNPVAYEFFYKRTIRLTGEVNESTATQVIMQLKMLDDLKVGDPTLKGDITLIINSPGGNVSDGMAIYDAIQSLRNDVRTVCEGECASMGAFILAAGTHGKRSAAPNAMIMIHQPSGGAQGQATDIALQAKSMAYTKQHMTELLSRHTGIAYDDMAAMLERDKEMTSQRAVELGIIDKIESPRKPLPPIGVRHVDQSAPDYTP